MKSKTKMLSIVLAIVMILTSVSIGVPTFAASKPSATQITSIKAIEKGFKVKWKKKSCTGYQVQYSTSKKFTSKTSKTLKVNKAKTTSKTVKKLKAKKKYYVRVRTYKTVKKKNYYSKWSANYSVTTKAKKTSSSNSNTTSSSSATPQIKSVERVKGTTNFNVSYSTVKGAVDYEVQVATTSSFKKNNSSDPTIKYPSNSNITINNECQGDDLFAENLFDDDLTSSKYSVKYPKRYLRVRARFLDKNYNESYSKWSNVFTYTGVLNDEQENYVSIMNNAFKQMNISSSESDFDKLVKIQRWIDANWVYGDGWTVYELATKKEGGCNQFAMNFNCFAHMAGIESYIIGGELKEPGPGHYWNWIKVGGQWYDYDCEGTYSNGDKMTLRFFKKEIEKHYTIKSKYDSLIFNSNPKADDNSVNAMNEQMKNAIYK